MFAKGALFISNNIGFHFYKLTGDDIALVYSGILIMMFITSIGSTQEFTLSLSGLFALSLLIYILSTMYGPNSNNSIHAAEGLPYMRDSCWNRLGDCLLVVLSLAMQSVDLARREDASLAPYRLASLSTIFMFTLTGVRKNCLVLVWFISMIFRLTVVQTSSPRTELNSAQHAGAYVSNVGLTPTLSVLYSFHYFALGLILYEIIYLIGTEIVRLRLRPRVILQDIPTITKIEHSVFSIFYHQYNLLPPIALSQYDHLLLLLHMSKHQVLTRLHVRQKRMFSKMQAELIRQTIEIETPADGDAAVKPQHHESHENLTEQKLDAKIKDVRMRERVWSMGLKFDPSNIMFRSKMQSSENLNRAVSEDEALWPWHSKEAIICEASLPARYQDFKTTRLGLYTDVKLERWFLTWSFVSITRLLTSAQKIIIGYLLLCLFSNLGAFNDMLPSIIVHGFRTKLACALYISRLGSYLICLALFLPSIIYSSSNKQLEWVDLAEKQILKYRALGLYMIVNGILDWLLVAEQFNDSLSHRHFLGRSTSFLQQITFLPFLLAVPPHVLAGCLLVAVVILVSLTSVWPVSAWQILYDLSLVSGSCAATVLFVSVPYFKALRALFATYAAPYLLYLEALRPQDAAPLATHTSTLPQENLYRSETKGTDPVNKTLRSSIRISSPPVDHLRHTIEPGL